MSPVRRGQNLLYSQSWLNQIPLVVSSLLCLSLISYLSVYFPQVAYVPKSLTGWGYDLPILFLIPLILFLKLIYVVLNERFVLTPEYMIHVVGRISWKERTVRLEYGRIQEIEILQTILQRIFGLGDIVIVPIAGTSQTNIHMHGVSNPRQVKDAIRQRQHGSEEKP